LGIEKVEVSVVDLTPVKEKALNIALNKIQGEWDFPKLKDLLEELDTGGFDIEITGFDNAEIEDLMTQFHVPAEGLTEDDAIPEKVETVCKTGDLWQLGNHRLLCGDATKKEDVERLMGREKADMVFTDPPYGIGIVRDGHIGGGNICKVGQYQVVKGDDKPFDPGWLLSHGKVQVIFGANYFADKLPIRAGWIIWDKRDGIASNNFADCELAWSSEESPARIYRCVWMGMVKEGESGKRCHPTQKPIKLCQDILDEFPNGQVIFDPYGGSGSTLIACEKLGRQCRMMEIDEHYCDVIIQRWQDFTGRQAEKLN